MSSRDPSAAEFHRPFHAPADQRWSVVGVFAACAALAMLAIAVSPFPRERAHLLIFVFVACLPVLLLRRWPLRLLVLSVGASVLVIASGKATLPFDAVLGLSMYFVASRLPRRVSIAFGAAAAAGLATALMYSAIALKSAPLTADAMEGFLPLIAAWFIGDSMAARRHYLAGLAEQAERERLTEADRARLLVREERVRIARELHDVVAHTLAVMTVQAGVGRRLMAKRPEEARNALESIESIGRTAQEEIRVVLGLLRDEEVGSAALAPAPRLLDLEQLAETVSASGTHVTLRMSGVDRQLSLALELSIYRVVQEALTNVVKHAPGSNATVGVDVSDDDVRVEVTDDGGPSEQHFGSAEWAAGSVAGHGIVGMRERIGAFGGWLLAEPLPGRGFRVVAKVPVDSSESIQSAV